MNPIVAVLAIVLAYFCGTLPSAILIAKSKGIDITTFGSGNPGASNISRALGAKYGALVFLLDAAKGAIPVVVTRIPTDRFCVCCCSNCRPYVSRHAPLQRWQRSRNRRWSSASTSPSRHDRHTHRMASHYESQQEGIDCIHCNSSNHAHCTCCARNCWLGIVDLLGMGVLVEIRHISNIKRLISGSEPPVTGVSH